MARLTQGDRAPNGDVIAVNDEIVQLADLWPKAPTLLTFLRHFG